MVLTLLEENEACGVLWCTMSCDLARQRLHEEAQASEEPEEATLLAVSMLNTLADDYSTCGVAELPTRYAQFFHDSTSDCSSGFASPAGLFADTDDVSPGALWRTLCDTAYVHQPGGELSRTAPAAPLTQVSSHSARVHQPRGMSKTVPVVLSLASHTFTSFTDLPPCDTARSQEQHSQLSSIRDSARDDPPSATDLNRTSPVLGSTKNSQLKLFTNGTTPPAQPGKKTTSRRRTSVASSSSPNWRSMKRFILNKMHGLWRNDKNTHASRAASKEAVAPPRQNPNLLLRTYHGQRPA